MENTPFMLDGLCYAQMMMMMLMMYGYVQFNCTQLTAQTVWRAFPKRCGRFNIQIIVF